MKIKVVYFNHAQQNCGVYQYGRALADKLARADCFHFFYAEVLSQREFVDFVEKHSDADVIYINYHPATMPWINRDLIVSVDKPVIGILHEFDYITAFSEAADIFDFRALIDPSIDSRVPNVTSHPRVLIGYKPKTKVRPVFTVGSFGFGTPSKCFDHIVKLVQRAYAEAVIRFNIPPSFFCDPTGEQARKIADSCRAMVAGSKISLEVTHDFLSPQQLVDFLAENTINLFAYTDDKGRGISSAIDFAVAAGRPFGVSDSGMFRHLQYVCPEVFISKFGIKEILENADLPAKKLKNIWSDASLISSYQMAAKNAIDAFDAFRKRKRLFNIVLDDIERTRYENDVVELKEKCPQMMGKKVQEANVQQAFVKAAVEHFSGGKKNLNVLCIGSFEDTAYETLKTKGYNIVGIDPAINIDLDTFYNQRSTVKSSFDIIFSTSVIEHVKDDERFISQIRDLLAVDGVAILTMDYSDTYREGAAKPSVDYRLYTSKDILFRLIPRLHYCELVDYCFWQRSVPDFTYDGVRYSFASLVFRRKRPDEKSLSFALSLEQAALENHCIGLTEERDRLAKEVNERDGRIAQLTTHIQQRLAFYERELNAVYRSRSWRITAPLREIMKALRRTVQLPKRLIKRILLAVIRQVRTRPGLKVRVILLVGRFPKLDTRLRAFAHALGQQVVSGTMSARPRSLTADETNKLILYPGSRSETVSSLLPGNRVFYFFVDYTVVCPVNTGVQRVTRCLARALLEKGERVMFVKWDDHNKRLVLVNRSELGYLAQHNGPQLTESIIQTYSEADSNHVPVSSHGEFERHWLVIPEVTHVDSRSVNFTLDVIMAAKRLGLKTAFIFYDAIPLKRSEFSTLAPRHKYYMQQLLLADVIVPISNWSKQDLVSFFQIYERDTLSLTPRIETIALPNQTLLAPRTTTDLLLARQSKLILSVGNIEPRKNQTTLIQAFNKFCFENPNDSWELVLVGNLHPDVAQEIIRAIELNPKIKYLAHAPDSELEALYQSCALTVFPSVEEGFGLPIVESLWHAKPCICANFGAMAEVAEGGGCYTVDVRNQDELAEAMKRLISEPSLREQLSQQAAARPMSSWADYARHFTDLLQRENEPLNRLGVVYYWVDHTTTYPENTGIQRVVRGLARSLIELGIKLVPVKWDSSNRQFYSPNHEELLHLERWNGPRHLGWADWVLPCPNERGWLLIPELTTYPGGPDLGAVKHYASSIGLRTAAIFYDALPWKLKQIYPPQAYEAHKAYMESLLLFEAIYPISENSRRDLLNFWMNSDHRTPNLDSRLRACVLPGEFLEADREYRIKTSQDEVTRILSVGTVEPRKNHLALLEAFVQVTKQTSRPVELILAGGCPFPDLAEKVNKNIQHIPGIRWEQSVDDKRLREFYIDCDFTVYPSLDEGFGLPIMESLWNARPCICRNTGAMAEIVEEGGCLTVETADPEALAHAMLQLIENPELRKRLGEEAVKRPFKTWAEYAREVATHMATERAVPIQQNLPMILEKNAFFSQFINLQPRPILSICITTYNRADWLALNLKNLARLLPSSRSDAEIVVCDNCSTDQTTNIVRPYLRRADFHYYRNQSNVGMLGNLRVTAQLARGEYIWILGDDDLIKPGSIERVLQAIRQHPDVGLIYLNYAFTRIADAKAVGDLDVFLNESTPIVAAGQDLLASVKQVCTQSENFFTAIYCLIFRRNHAVRAHSQNTEGRPFSTMLTCIPTTYYVLNFMADEPAYWIGEPQVVVNMNVSWMKYAPLWILERLPEVYDLAEKIGADPKLVDRWRKNNLPGVFYFFKEIFENDQEGNLKYFSVQRLIARMKHIPEFVQNIDALRRVYDKAYLRGEQGASVPTSYVFPLYDK